ncbi:hypothetical protein PP939_gp057 [Rhizobium phage RL38J1]|uniref:Uncharacterized protein n=1 Tax=Rhizobium phage RL38J1 TaxID=2663232 RepID=A0A6B9J6I8_9CAUD|nr:hypothetical protein PP939_gp057 [Rhizobium phage RL38J1]QGZ13891.1 hypothetical protein RL38J1_057 [Rhizobium phage RL38J1]
MTDTQLRKFLRGDNDVIQNYPTDVLIWLNYEGHKHTQIKGRPANVLIKRDEHPTVSLEKYLSKFVEYLYRNDMSRLKKEELYIKFTNRMDEVDADFVYQITTGSLKLDLDRVRAYAGDRRIGGDANGAYIFLDSYLEAVPEPVAPAAKAKKLVVSIDSLGASEEDLDELNGDDAKKIVKQDGAGETEKQPAGDKVVPDASTAAPAEQPAKRRGGRRKKTEGETPSA